MYHNYKEKRRESWGEFNKDIEKIYNRELIPGELERNLGKSIKEK